MSQQQIEGQPLNLTDEERAALPELLPLSPEDNDPAKWVVGVYVQQPSVARIVHYHSYGTPGGEYKSKPVAAVVTGVADDGETVGLCILNPTGIFFNTAVPHAPNDEPTPGHWNWPPRV